MAGSQTGDVTELGAMWPGKLPLLEIPVGKTVQFNLSSPDVIHAFWVVPFEFKRDVLPDHPNHFEITATKTGTFTGALLRAVRSVPQPDAVHPEDRDPGSSSSSGSPSSRHQQLASGGVQ